LCLDPRASENRRPPAPHALSVRRRTESPSNRPVHLEQRKLDADLKRLIELDEQASTKQRDRAAYLALTDAVIEALPDALIVTDAQGGIVLFNTRAEFMFGYERSEILGRTVETLLPERDRIRHARSRDGYSRFDLSERNRTMGVGLNLKGVHRDGHEFPVEITLGRMVVPMGICNLALVRFSPRLLADQARMDVAGPGPGAGPEAGPGGGDSGA
jgi:PAS domain S-box-containing protein